MIADKIRALREKCGITQTELAKSLGITRSGVNAWEMGISVPSTQYVVRLAEYFSVSTDYLLGVSKTSVVSVEGLSEKEIAAIVDIIECLRNKLK